MCDPITIGVTTAIVAGGFQIAGQLQQGEAAAGAYKYQASLKQQQANVVTQYAEQQKRLIEQTAGINISAVQTGAAQESKRLAREVAVLSGSQRAAIGALGIGGVTATDITIDTSNKSIMDQLAIRYNANIRSYELSEAAKRDIYTVGEEAKFRAFGLRSEASQYEVAAKNARRAARIKAGTTLLSTAATVAGFSALRVPGGGGGTSLTPRAGSQNLIQF